MDAVPAALSSLAAVPEVAEVTERAREACTRLRWHQALRRRIPEAAAESRVRGAWASAELDGARNNVDIVRDLMRGAREWPEALDPAERVLRGAVNATAETEHVAGLVLTSPMQALARLHVAAASDLVESSAALGRPRLGDESCGELVDLGEPVPPAQIRGRLDGVVALLSAPGAPALLVAALVHAEIATIRPFTHGNGLVARAMERAIIKASGLDPTGVAVPEAGHGAEGGPAYLGSLAAYATGGREGVLLWLTHAGGAVEAAAGEGLVIADAVLAGRLS
ncbi:MULTISPECIES: Fic family protein [unclassified Janibacter]|uniref:Fic family protein n=1 Tax=unclassified Janibacter TaxID=2649294 RepID=UPI003D06DD44